MIYTKMQINAHFNTHHILTDKQHDSGESAPVALHTSSSSTFMPRASTTTIHHIDAVLLDFSKAFDTVPSLSTFYRNLTSMEFAVTPFPGFFLRIMDPAGRR